MWGKNLPKVSQLKKDKVGNTKPGPSNYKAQSSNTVQCW